MAAIAFTDNRIPLITAHCGLNIGFPLTSVALNSVAPWFRGSVLSRGSDLCGSEALISGVAALRPPCPP